MTKSKVKHTLKTFGETTGVKGIGRVLKSRSVCLKLLWLVAVLTGASVALYQLSLLLQRYFKYDTTIKVTEEAEAPEFPEITLCKLNPISQDMEQFLSLDDYLSFIDEFMKHTTLDDIRKVEGLENITKDQFDQTESMISSISGYFENIPASREDSRKHFVDNFLIECVFYDWDWHELGLNCSHTLFKIVHHPQYYACPTVSVPEEYLTKIRGVTLTLFLDDFNGAMAHHYQPNILLSKAKGIRMKLHQRGTLPILKEGVSLSPGQESTVKLWVNKRELMTEPYGSCTDEEYLEDDDEGKERYIYATGSCKELKYQTYLMDKCHCVSQLYEFSNRQMDGKDFCGKLYSQNPSELAEFYHSLNVTFKEFPVNIKNILFDDMKQTIKNLACTITQTPLKLTSSDCAPACSSLKYYTSVSQAQWPLLSYHLPFWEHLIQNSTFNDSFVEYQEIHEKVKAHGYTTEIIEELKNVDASIEKNFLLVTVSFEDESFQLTKQYPALTWEVLFANLGGALNLWIGVSFMTIIELSELIYHLVTLCCRRQKEEEPVGDKGNSIVPLE